MSSRNVTSAINRTGKCYNFAPSQQVTGLMVKVDWTSSQTVNIVTNKAFRYTVYTVSKIRGQYEILSVSVMSFRAGMHIRLVKSGMEGYYYIVCMETGRCTCMAGRVQQGCKHVDGLVFYRSEERVASHRITPMPVVGTCLVAA